MADEQSTFQSEAVELSELERITQRLNTFTVGLKPANAEQVNQIMQKGLSAGNFKLDELDALVQIREQVNAGIIDYNTQVQVATKRIQELEQEELQKQKDLLARTLVEKDELVTEERKLKKLAQQELKIVAEQNKILQAQLEALSNVQNNVTSKPIQDLLDESRASAEMNASDRPKSKAWDMVRQARPNELLTQDEELAEKIEDTKKAFKDFEAETQVVPTPALQDNVDFKPAGTSVDSFYDEVERVNEVAEADELLADEPHPSNDELMGEPDVDDDVEVGFADDFDDDEDFVDDENFYNGIPETVPSTGQVTSKPVISGGNAPNIQAQVSEPENIVAPVEEEKKTIPTFDTEEELIASVNAKVNIIEDEAEEEYEEITIPSRSELESISKAEVQAEGDKLGFELSGSKEEMVDQFEEQTEAFIASLQEDGDFISASETEETRSAEEKKDGDDDVRDGGYF